MRQKTTYIKILAALVFPLYLLGLSGCVSSPQPVAVEEKAPQAAPTPTSDKEGVKVAGKAEKEPDKRKKRKRRSRRLAARMKSEREARSEAKDLLKRLSREKEEKEKAVEKRGMTEEERLAKKTILAAKYEAILTRPGTPEKRKSEILTRLAEIAFEQEEAALRMSYENDTDMDILPGDKYPKSIEYYRRLADDYPDSPQTLNAYYNLGYLYGEEGLLVPSARAYGAVLERDPTSPYATEIYMRLGEASFIVGMYRDAIKNYKAVIDSGRDEYRDKALYKLGWSQYKLDDYATAVHTFSLIVDQGENSPESLKNETVEIMGRAFVEWGGVEKVEQYLAGREMGKFYGDNLYKKLGDLYVDGARFKDSAAAYGKCVDAYPLTALGLEAERGIITSHMAQRDPESANARRWYWAGKYAPGTPWSDANPELAAERDVQLEEGLRLAGLYRHSRAQRGEGSLSQALEIYAKYNELYGIVTEDGYEMGYAQAQAFKEAEDFAASAAMYGEVAESATFTSHREDASYRRIDVLGLLWAQRPEVFNEYIAAHQRYVELNPETEIVPTILFAMGELNFEAERFPESRSAFGRVADDYPDHELTPEAVERIARCYFREEAFGDSELSARRALTLDPKEETRENALKLVSFSIFRQAEVAEAETRLEDAVHHFKRLAGEFPVGEAAQVSLYRAAENLRTLGREEEASAVYKMLAENYRSSKYAESALTLSSEILSSLGDWGGVAENYEGLYRLNPDGPEAESHLFRAALANQKAKNAENALVLFVEFNEKFIDSHRRAQTFFRIAEIKHAGGDEEGALEAYALTWETPALEDEELYRAKAALVMGEKQLTKFRAIELKGDLAQALLDKEDVLEVALGHLVDAASLPFVETLAASLYYAGEAFEQMKNAILDSERPEGLSEEENEEYQFLLEEKAFPLEDQAVAYYKRGIDASRKTGVHTEWVDRMYARLEVVQPWVYQRSEETSDAWAAPRYPGRGWERQL